MQRLLTPDHLARLLGDFPRAPAYRGLCQALQALIGDGRIGNDTRLPSERAVAQALAVSRNTVTRAYADLVSAGFASARVGAGTYAVVPLDRRRAHDHALLPMTMSRQAEGVIDLNCAAGAALPGIMPAYERALAALPAYLGSDGYLPSGLPALQNRIAQGYTQRGLPTCPGQIIITAGALSAIAIIARALSRPGQRLMLETPVYSNAIEALRSGGARLLGTPLADPLGQRGWDLEGIRSTLRQAAPPLSYLIADFQNPTGFLMDESDRADYAAALRRAGSIAIVDESLQSTSLLDTAMPAPFASHAPDAITVGSASKLCWGGLRVGWIRAPQALVERIVNARVQVDLGSSLFDQLVVLELLASDELLLARRQQLRQRRDALATALRTQLPDWRFRLPEGGLSLWVRMPHGSATQLAAAMTPHGVHFAPGPVFSVEGGNDNWLRLPFAKPEDQLIQAVQSIATVWSQLQDRRPRPRSPERVLIA